MADTLVMIPGNTTQGTGYSAGIFTTDPTAAGSFESGQFINMPGFGNFAAIGPTQQLLALAGTYTITGTTTTGGLSAIYWGTNNLMVNVGPEIHATSTQTLSQSSWTGVEFVNSVGQSQTFLTASASSYTLQSDKSATWTFADTTKAFTLGVPVALYFF